MKAVLIVAGVLGAAAIVSACGGATGLEWGERREDPPSARPQPGAPTVVGAGGVPGKVVDLGAESGSTAERGESGTGTGTGTEAGAGAGTFKCELALPEDERFAAMTDEDAAVFCAFLACARGGYGTHDIACADGTHTIVMPADEATCVDQMRTAARGAGSACQLTMGMMDACYGPWGEDPCVQPTSCSAIDAVAATCN